MRSAAPRGRRIGPNVARYFAVAVPVHLWSQAISQASVAQGKSLSENARAFALLTMAISDGLVSSMETKYHYVFWRPYTAIRAGDTDGNPRTDPDPLWTTFIPTPCFPSYPSAHASGSYAGRAIAEKIFGSGGQDITLSHPGIPEVTLHYTKFSQITDDIDDARVFGGIHFRFDQEAGAHQGRKRRLLCLQEQPAAQRRRRRLQRRIDAAEHIRCEKAYLGSAATNQDPICERPLCRHLECRC